MNLRKRASPAPSGSTSPSWRMFCAVETPPEIVTKAAEHAYRLQSEFPSVAASWNREGRFHITLKFLANAPLDRVADISRAAALATADLSVFKIDVAGAGAFPTHGPPRVLWLGIEDSAQRLVQLQQRLEDECVSLGFAREERTFHPHLTLARLREPKGAKELALAHKRLGFPAVEMIVSELLVIRSELNPKGAKYSEISRHPLKVAGIIPLIV